MKYICTQDNTTPEVKERIRDLIHGTREGVVHTLKDRSCFWERVAQAAKKETEKVYATNVKEEIDRFVEIINQADLPPLSPWWVYRSVLSQGAFRFQMCHVSNVVIDVSPKPKKKDLFISDRITVDVLDDENYESMKPPQADYAATYDLIILSFPKISVVEFARRWQVTTASVRQWIRRGTLISPCQYSSAWLFDRFATPPQQREWGEYKARTYTWSPPIELSETKGWKKNCPKELHELNKYCEATIVRTTNSKGKERDKKTGILDDLEAKKEYCVSLKSGDGGTKTVEIDSKEREAFETMLIANPNISPEQTEL